MTFSEERRDQAAIAMMPYCIDLVRRQGLFHGPTILEEAAKAAYQAADALEKARNKK